MQNYEIKNEEIKKEFSKMLNRDSEMKNRQLRFSWSNWGFGREDIEITCKRLSRTGISYIELHGNHYGKDLGYRTKHILPVLKDYGLKVSGICGMFSPECDMSSPSGTIRQRAVDYIKREVEFAKEVEGEYLLIVPAAVGRSQKYDESEVARSLDTLRAAADLFEQYGIKGAIEPIRSAETSIIHTVKEAKSYLKELNHPGVQWINGDVYHMQSEESHVGEAILEAGNQLINLHLADSNRGALGSGSLDIDSIIRALYIIQYDKRGGFVTPEPLGPGGTPYPAMHGVMDSHFLDAMVVQSYQYFRERESAVKQRKSWDPADS